MQHEPTPSRKRPRRKPALALAAAALLLTTPALAQDAGESTTTDESAWLRTWTRHDLPSLPLRLEAVRGGALLRALPGQPGRIGIHAGGPGLARLRVSDAVTGGVWSGDQAFGRWLSTEPVQQAVLPGLVGHLQDGATVHLVFHDGDPAEGGSVVSELSYVAGQDDLATFQAAVRAAADEATHMVLNVTGRTIALPGAGDVIEETPTDDD